MNKKVKIVLIIIAINLVIALIFSQIFKKIIPSYVSDSIKNFEKDTLLMNRIGGYANDFKAEFQDKSYDGDTSQFKIQIFGYKKGILFKGSAVKNDNKWSIFKTDTLIYNYE